MILADTSAWVEYDRATRSRVDRRLTELIWWRRTGRDRAGGHGGLVGCSQRRSRTRVAPAAVAFDLLRFDPVVDFDAAVRIYRSCRRQGVTPRGMVDCLIASVAHRHGASLLARNVDLVRVARVVGVALDDASR